MKTISDLERYSRQMRLPSMGSTGQQRLSESRVLVVGLGALGSTSTELLARAGVGYLRIIDRDFVDLSNLQRQQLYCEDDAREGLPKAMAAARRLAEINSQIEIEPRVADVNHHNIEDLVDTIDLIVDGTDNFETRFLINDVAVARRLPWIFGGCLGWEGQTMNIIPGETACLGCLMPAGPPLAGDLPTCDTAGVLGPIVTLVASIQATEALKFLSGNRAAMSSHLLAVSLFENHISSLTVPRLRAAPDSRERVESCATCVRGEFPWLRGELGSETVVLCGRNSVQVSPSSPTQFDLTELARNLEGVVQINGNSMFFLRFRHEAFEVTVFPDGRAIISGTDQIAVAKSLYGRFVGN